MKFRYFFLFFVCFMLSIPLTANGKHYPSPCQLHFPSDATLSWQCRHLRPGESLEDLFGDQWPAVLRFNRIDRRHAYHGASMKVPESLEAVVGFNPLPRMYPEAAVEEKFILVDLSEQFLGAYEFGELIFSVPIASGEYGNETPTGEFRITSADAAHRSSLYTLEGSDTPYPMTYALKFHTNRLGVSFWIHGRDLPGVPASHGCIGLYDEAMQKEHYGFPNTPVLEDAKKLYRWALGTLPDAQTVILKNGPKVLIIGQIPHVSPVQ